MVDPEGRQAIVLYPGCLILARFQNYERAAAWVLTDLGFHTRAPEPFCCCGATLLPGTSDRWLHLAGYTMAQAAKQGALLVTLCGNCFHNFHRAQRILEADEKNRRSVAETLAALGMPPPEGVEVRHLLHLLAGQTALIENRTVRVFPGRVAITYPCQVFRPLPLAGADETSTMLAIVKALGCEVVDYPAQYECCGATALLFDKDLALSQGKSKLEQAATEGADLLVAGCGNCLLLLNRHRPAMHLNGEAASLPACSVAELVAWSMGHAVEKLDQLYK